MGAAALTFPGALRIAGDADGVADALAQLLGDEAARAAMAAAAQALVDHGRGALQRTLQHIQPDLPA